MPLRPTPVALSGVRVPSVFLPNNPRFATKKLWDAKNKSDDDWQGLELKPLRVRSAWQELEKKEKKGRRKTSVDLQNSYTKLLVDRTSAHFGRTKDDLRRMAGPLDRMARRKEVHPNNFKAKWMAHITKFTRLVKFFRVWFLDFHIIRNLALVIKRLDSIMSNGAAQERLMGQLRRVEDRMKTITCSRHVAEVSEERKKLFAIANTLRSFEVEFAPAQSETGAGKGEHINPHPFPSKTLRAVETSLLESEVLSMELIVRKRLLEAPGIQRDVLRTLRKFGYKPNFPDPPSEEPDDEE
ncbi:hypothetical protein EV127DRAFT_413728 [Xylaria flabelliformis]|nr:hypothetical protein EV127DRAFT_413728 [Xylaria flabelliformis]